MYNRMFLLLMLWSQSSFAALPECNLCYKKSSSCSSQVSQFNLTEDDCNMVYYPLNSSECSSLNLSRENYGSSLGIMRLQSYAYILDPLTQAAFNVSFSNINWTHLEMRFMQNGAAEKNTCRHFRVSEKFLAVKKISLFYDCLWSHSDYEEKTYNFEYLARNSASSEYHKYVFIVPRGVSINPSETQLSNWEVFMYIDISSFEFRTVTLRAQTLPKHFNVTEYLVKVHSGINGDSVCKDERIITAKESEDEITYTWNLGILHGSYFFTVQPLSTACPESRCLTSRSPLITISTNYDPIYVGIVLVAVILLLVIFFCLKVYGSKGPEFVKKPSLLLIYRSTHTSHIRVVVELAKYLRKHCDINAMVDELDVNKSKSQSPFNWYNDAIDEADFIAVVSSPTCCNSISGIYPKADEAALCLLRGSGFKRENFAKTYKLMVFMLPYGSKKHLPVETKNIGLHFKIPSHLKEVSHYIHNFREMYFFERYYHFVKTRINFMGRFIKNRNYLNKECDWPKLQMAIQEATTEIKICAENKDRLDLRNDCCLQTKKIFHESGKENEVLEDPLVMISSTSPLDNTNVYAEYPGSLDDFDLLGLNTTQVVIENANLKDIRGLDGLDLG